MREAFINALRTFSENGHVQEKFEPDYIIGELSTRGVLSRAEADDILAKSSRLARQKELFLDFMPKRNDGAFQTLLDVLDEERYHWAREMLENIYEKEMRPKKRSSLD